MLLHFILCLFTLPRTMASPRSAEETFQGDTTRAIVSNIAKPGCQTQCGNVIVPYPFGTGNDTDTDCSLDDLFYMNCNSSYNPPKLFLGSSNIEIYSISDSELRISNFVSYKCYDEYGDVDDEDIWTVNIKPFTFSEKNKFTVIGCDDYALIRWTEGIHFSSGCIGLCSKAPDVPDGYCSGIGCCKTAIPKGQKGFDVTLYTFQNHTDVWSFNRCGYVFLAEEDSFEFRGERDLSNRLEFVERIMSTVPRVLDWVIAPGQNCTNATECKENSSCYNVDGGGYRCRCNQGYEGNAYLDPGCQDINECEDPRKHTCYGDCINTPGSYKCTCPPGYIGYARTPNGCRHVAKDSKKKIVVEFTSGVVLGSGILVLAIWIYKVVQKRKDKKRREKFFERNGGLLLQQQISNGEDAVERTRLFSAKELEKATDGYDGKRILGRGGQGIVYKGMLTDGKIVAIKKSKLVDKSQIEQFINEVFLLSQISHRNVVKLFGCCLETEVPVLVYEFVSNGSLSQFIHDENYEFPTFWSIRLQIATEIAQAVAYLHCATSIPIYHRDIKSENILLDEKFRAKLSDFGISKSVLGDRTHLSTLVKGTFGYIDPEYFHSGQFTAKSDVYSFGVVLVELLTRKKPIDLTTPGESRSLARLILTTEEGLVSKNIDDRVLLDGSKEQLIAVAKLAKRCLNLNGELRPTMKEVATELEGIRSSH